MKRYLILSLVGLLAAWACRAEKFEWPAHGVTFEVPDGGVVTYNSPTVIEIQWYDLTVVLKARHKQPSDDDDEDTRNALRSTAAGYNMFDTEIVKAKVKGCKGWQLNGTLPDGSRGCLTGVRSKKTDLALQIEINYLAENRPAVDKILKSIRIAKKKGVKQKVQKPGEKQKPIKPGTLQGDELHYI